MSNIPYTEKNREKLATAVVENMDLKDMIQALYEQELECYEQCEDTFQELWHNYYVVNSDDLRLGDEVYWNDPDEGTCSGYGTFVRHLDESAAVIKKDDVEIEVFIQELSQMSKLYKNWPIHNLIAHPVSELAYWVVRPFSKVRAEKVSKLIHDSTLPEGFENE